MTDSVSRDLKELCILRGAGGLTAAQFELAKDVVLRRATAVFRAHGKGEAGGYGGGEAPSCEHGSLEVQSLSSVPASWLGKLQCSRCSREGPAEEFTGCRACDYDLCPKCSRRETRVRRKVAELQSRSDEQNGSGFKAIRPDWAVAAVTEHSVGSWSNPGRRKPSETPRDNEVARYERRHRGRVARGVSADTEVIFPFEQYSDASSSFHRDPREFRSVAKPPSHASQLHAPRAQRARAAREAGLVLPAGHAGQQDRAGGGGVPREGSEDDQAIPASHGGGAILRFEEVKEEDHAALAKLVKKKKARRTAVQQAEERRRQADRPPASPDAARPRPPSTLVTADSDQFHSEAGSSDGAKPHTRMTTAESLCAGGGAGSPASPPPPPFIAPGISLVRVDSDGPSSTSGTVTPPEIVRHDQGSPASAAAAEPDHFAPAVQTTILTHDSPPLPPAGHLPNARVSSLGGTVSSVTLSGPATLKRPPSQSPAKHIVRWPLDVDV
ncbi:hypothetical protein DIPPA_15257 [Diplonema papillatum]|nr:hypothetical protein DIPPA_15257 [Diplonema papillatum]